MILNKINNFLRSPAYIILFAAVVFFGWLLEIYLPVLYIVCLLLAFLFVTQKDLTPIIVPVLLITFLFPHKTEEMDFAASLIPTVPIVIAAIIFYIFKNKPKVVKGAYFSGFLIALIGVIPGGLFIDKVALNFLVTSGCAAVIVLIYIMFVSVCKENFKKTALYTLVAMTAIVLLQVTVYLLTEDQSQVVNLKIMHLGWGETNMIAAVLSMLLPITLYLAAKSKPWLYVPMAFLQVIAIFIIKSRSNMVIVAIFMPILLIISYMHSKNRRVYIYSLLATLAALAVVVLICLPTFIQLFKYTLKNGFFSDSGRFKLYRKAIDDFLLNPSFGVGFIYMQDKVLPGAPFWYHNTILQLLASLGVFGLCLFVPFFWQRYTVPLKRFNTLNFFLLCSIVMSALYGLLDISFFNIYPHFITICLYVIIEREKDTIDLFERYKLYPKKFRGKKIQHSVKESE